MDTIFLTAASVKNLPLVRLMIDSLRTFGGDLADAPFWVFAPDPEPVRAFETGATRLLPLTVPDLVAAYPFGRKVAACARAEQLAPAGTRSLVWVDAAYLFCQPPTLFALGADFDAAFRPAHIRNVGLPPSEPLDAFWGGICAALGVDDVPGAVTSFVDGQLLRTYFNSHAFAVNPALGLMRRWYELFQQLVGDAAFQSAACADDIHQIFLFQALLSALVASSVEPARVRILPPACNYPCNLHERVPAEKRPAALNDVVSFAYEECDIRPGALTGIEVREPLRAWLETWLPKE
ncbi:MAG: hypothetical protein FD146_2165 [Anaerolineaceae bacterium]|nr:MAG: hypothetical protein FD146_2165 [Anaerolineaceae bacterium]